jgi:hypothetical protein
VAGQAKAFAPSKVIQYHRHVNVHAPDLGPDVRDEDTAVTRRAVTGAAVICAAVICEVMRDLMAS